MASTILVNVEHAPDLLALWVSLDGKLADAYKVEARVYDATDGLPGDDVTLDGQVGEWVDVTTTGRLSVGRYALIEPGTGRPWKPATTILRGRVLWRVEVSQGDDPEYVDRAFEALPLDVARTSGPSIVLAVDVIERLGLDATEERVKTYRPKILRWQALAEQYCRVRFWPVRQTRRFSSCRGEFVFLPEPLFGVESIVENELLVDLTEITIHGATGPDRLDPRIEIDGEWTQFYPQIVAGVWGFFEPDTLGAPLLVQDAILDEIVEDIAPGSGGGGGAAGPKKRERTDEHEIEWAVTVGASKAGGLSIFSARTRDVLLMYRAPSIVTAPRVLL